MIRDLTFVCAYYENAGQLLEQQRIWAAYAPELRAHFHVIVTDDASPTAPARDVFAPAGLASQRLYRVAKNRRWDWLIARNIGVAQASTDWVLLTDIDHVLPEVTLRQLLTADVWSGDVELELSPKGETRKTRGAPDPACIYRFTRVDAPHPWPWQFSELTAYKPHPNSWLMTRAMFDQMGGYDERFSGWYGSDSDFRERCKSVPFRSATRPALAVIRLHYPLVRYAREIIPDASTTTYQRKTKEDGYHVPRIKAAREREAGWRPKRLTLPYELERSV